MKKNKGNCFTATALVGCGGGTRTTRPPGYEPDKLPTALLRDIKLCASSGIMVLVTGLEPVRILLRRILSPLRLPIPPHEPIRKCHKILTPDSFNVKALAFVTLIPGSHL